MRRVPYVRTLYINGGTNVRLSYIRRGHFRTRQARAIFLPCSVFVRLDRLGVAADLLKRRRVLIRKALPSGSSERCAIIGPGGSY